MTPKNDRFKLSAGAPYAPAPRKVPKGPALLVPSGPIPEVFVGIDPGLSGGIAVYHPNAVTRSRVWAMPLAQGRAVGETLRVDGAALRDLFKGIVETAATDGENMLVAIEHVASRPRQAGVFTFGLNTGIIYGVLGALDIPVHIVASARWKPAMGLKRSPLESYQEGKEKSRLVAVSLFPHLAPDLSLKKDDGKAEALLLAVYTHHSAFRKVAK